MNKTAMLVCAFVAIGLTGISGYFLIPWLKSLKYGQTINKIGPVWHQNKEGTPTIGGLMMILGSAVALVVGYITLIIDMPEFLNDQYKIENIRLFSGFGVALAFGLIGFIDDYTKIAHKENLGLTAKGKLVLQFFVSTVYVVAMYYFAGIGTAVEIPFFGSIELGIFYFPIMVVFVSFFVNAVNLTDGIDGLAGSVTFFVSLGFIIISAFVGYFGTGLFATAIAGSCIGFVIWNFYPAKVFMGDTGSMFLGGAVVAMSFGISFPTIIVLVGIIYLCEALSVMIQVSYFKITKGKRIFKMTPIHHHFEMSGYSEIAIVLLFCFITVVGCALAFFAVTLF